MAQKIDEVRSSGIIKNRQSPQVAKREFDREAKKILQEWVRRRDGRDPATSEEDPADWMLRATYRLVKSLIHKGHEGILADLVEDIGQRHRGKTDISSKPFKQALLAMFWWNPEHTREPLLDRRRRSEFSDALEYAFRHRVQSKHLIGFIKSAGIKRIPAKLRGGKWEPGFEPRSISAPRSGERKGGSDGKVEWIEIV